MTMEDNSKAQSPVLRVGILGAANIARKNVKAIQHQYNVRHCKLVAIASRSKEKATQFLSNHVSQQQEVQGEENENDNERIKLYTGKDSYCQIINDVHIDALYIPLPTQLHLQYVKQAISAGKHVLVEKPVALSHKEYEEMSNLAIEKEKFLMDGTMFVHNPRTKEVVDFLSIRPNGNNDDGTNQNNEMNSVTRIQSNFTFLGDDDFFTNNIRILKNGDKLGCIGDLGWYCIRMAQLVFKAPAKYAQVVHYNLNDDGVPIDATCLVSFESNNQHNGQQQLGRQFKGDRILSFHCSFLHPLTQDISFYGYEKTIYMDDFVIPREEGEDKRNSSFQIKSQTLAHADLYSIHANELKESSPFDDDIGTCFNPPHEVLLLH